MPLENHDTDLSRLFSEAYRADETRCVEDLLKQIDISDEANLKIQIRAEKLVVAVRQLRLNKGGIDAFMAEYDLSSQEGVALMCLAEALLRIPDTLTADRLIRDKLSQADWYSHLGESDSLFVNAATWSLVLTGKWVRNDTYCNTELEHNLKGWMSRQSNAVIRKATLHAMKIMGNQFVMGETIQKAQKRAEKLEANGYRYSYDMLGEAARTEADAQVYLASYIDAIHAIGQNKPNLPMHERAGISIKLSAIHPRYEINQIARVQSELLPRVKSLANMAKHYNIGLTIDAEEADRLEISLQIIEALAMDPDLAAWQGLGLAVQAYQKRAPLVIDWLHELAQRSHHRIMVRLVKGAYWDSEIKNSQEFGLAGYPVYTRKAYTDVAYLACAKKMLAHRESFYCMFATHNAHTVSSIIEMADGYRDFEFQCLHGMGDTLYDQVVDRNHGFGMPCRIYAPVGNYKSLLAYLVRRLLENGANSSFVNRIIDTSIPISELIENPIIIARELKCTPHPGIPLPRNIYGDRMNSKGIDLSNQLELQELASEMTEAMKDEWLAVPIIADSIDSDGKSKALYNPANRKELIGYVTEATPEHVEHALNAAELAFPAWQATSAQNRAQCLRRMADLLETNMALLMAMAVKEAGKSIPNAIGEVREAVDFCRYYADQAEFHFSKPTELKGITGELNQFSLHGRGIFICISPWNFPLAIFLGEVTAALAAGNVVIAKPAEQTPLIATMAIELLHQAGVPRNVVQMLPGRGEIIGSQLVNDKRIGGVIFTGSTEVAHLINKSLANRTGPIVPFIAETGGQNAMIVDSSALPEQVVKDVIASAFDSAGQRCSALRVLFLQEDIADSTIEMLKGAMDELRVGDPNLLSTDIGPVIDEEARDNLLAHIELMKHEATLIHQVRLSSEAKLGTFVPPTAFELSSLSSLKREVFGPILHIIRFKAAELNKVVEQINNTGYGLTFGIHSRIQETIDYLCQNIRVGNVYVNRNIIGAVVGVQPFGGQGLSGTGPKAGGPLYLPRLAVERSLSVNTTASGGNASLMSLKD
ncbi:MAG: bifunctional proline dehydrogenase/L-glutamate gamma-semialdehyde dehydrogenase PutA [Gammaproteobacteria bacterium]|nr:bifunctional proline dehydrogenase/L-glutamate gamma-semialdehyde dehydrogenase PutA [Gammaproteobacteria bacterium]